MKRHARFMLFLLLIMSLIAAGCGDDDTAGTTASTPDSTTASSADDTAAEGDRPAITIGSTDFVEQLIVANMYAGALEAAGFEVTVEANLGPREVVAPALEGGEIDLIAEYAATALEFYNEAAGEATPDAAETTELLNAQLSERGLVALEPSPAIDSNAFVVTQATADELGIATLSELADVAGDLVLGGPPECPERPFCALGLEEVYGITFSEFRPLDVGGPLTVTALEDGDIDVGLLFSSDGVIADKGFVVLEDDMSLQNADNLVPVLREEVATDEVREILDAVSAALTTEDLQALNLRASNQEEPADLAQEWLEDNSLL